MTLTLHPRSIFRRNSPMKQAWSYLPRFYPRHVSFVNGVVRMLGAAPLGGVLLQGNGVESGWLGRLGEEPCPGRWGQASDEYEFVTSDAVSRGFRAGEELVAFDGFWGQSAQIILGHAAWNRANFRAMGLDDYIHCGVCWRVIEGAEPMYWHNSHGDIVCPRCYEDYVRKRSLAFMGLEGQAG